MSGFGNPVSVTPEDPQVPGQPLGDISVGRRVYMPLGEKGQLLR